jgi:hypothetical protein
MNDLLDFVAFCGDARIATTTGQCLTHSGPLPADRGTLLVAGAARPGGFRPRFDLPAGEVILSPDHSRLAVRQGNLWRTFDLATGREGYRFEQDGLTFLHALHPSGEMLARRTRETLELWLPDGQLFRSLALPRRKARYGKLQPALEEVLTFSACGKYLWLAACPADASDGLWLLGVDGWTVLDRTPVPPSLDNPDDCGTDTLAAWCENEMVVHPQTGWLAISRWAGDSFLSMTFHAAKGGKIVTHEHQVRVDDRPFGGEPVGHLTPGPGGWWYGIEALGCLLAWDWPAVKTMAAASDLGYEEKEFSDWDGFAAVGAVVLAHDCDDGEIQVLRSRTLEPLQTVRPYTSGELLPNGMLLQRMGDAMQALAFEVARKDWNVVLEMDGAARCCRKVFRKVRGRWRDVTAEVAWIAPAFDFERY